MVCFLLHFSPIKPFYRLLRMPFYIIISIVLISCLIMRYKKSSKYSVLETISKDMKPHKSPSPRHSPLVVKKSNQRARVFSASSSKSRSRSKSRNHKNMKNHHILIFTGLMHELIYFMSKRSCHIFIVFSIKKG